MQSPTILIHQYPHTTWITPGVAQDWFLGFYLYKNKNLKISFISINQ